MEHDIELFKIDRPRVRAKEEEIIRDLLELVDHFEKVWRWRRQRVVESVLHEDNKIHHTTVHPDAYRSRWGGFETFVKLFSQYKLGQIDFTQLVNAKKKRNEREAISPHLRAQILNRYFS